MHPPRQTMLFVVCLLSCVGSSWAKPARFDSTEILPSTLLTSRTLPESTSDLGTPPPEPSKTGNRHPASESDDGTSVIISTSIHGSVSPTSSRPATNTRASPSSVEGSEATERSTRTVFVTYTTTNPTERSNRTCVTSAIGSGINIKTDHFNVTKNSTSLSINPTSISTTTTLLNWTFPGTTSSPSEATSAASSQGPGYCLVGSACAWKLGVGLGFGGTFALTIFVLISRRYRSHLDASHLEHRNNWNSRNNVLDEYESAPDQMAMKILDTSGTGTGTTSPYGGKADELYLPEDVQRIVDRVAEMRRQETRMPADAYGSIKRKPLPTYSNGYRDSDDLDSQGL